MFNIVSCIGFNEDDWTLYFFKQFIIFSTIMFSDSQTAIISNNSAL